MKFIGVSLFLLLVFGNATSAFAECTGDIQGIWEKRPVGSNDNYDMIDTFRIDSKSGILSICERDRSWDSGFQDKGDELVFTYARRQRVLRKAENGEFISRSWIAEYKGVKSEYQVRAVR